MDRSMDRCLLQGDLNADPGALSGSTPEHECPAEHRCPLPHAEQSEAPPGIPPDLPVEANAIVLGQKDDVRIALDNGEAKALGLRVLEGIGQRLLGETVDHGLRFRVEPPIESNHMKIDAEPGMSCHLFEIEIQGRLQSQVAQEGRMKTVRDATNLR